MPAQISGGGAVYYTEFDSAPSLEQCLIDGAGQPIDLTGALVTISIATALGMSPYWHGPVGLIVDRSPCVVDSDQTIDGKRGWITWTPSNRGPEDDLTPVGQFLYTFGIIYPDGGEQTIPPNTYLPLVIKERVGGRH